ncbi:MAG: hypothetical protein FJX76_22685 [Armatimonadetes bacterium]|nr:hypothetical protein [Armatimonadota bacterium]
MDIASFNIHDDAAEAYQEALLERFAESPEYAAAALEDGDWGDPLEALGACRNPRRGTGTTTRVLSGGPRQAERRTISSAWRRYASCSG